MAYRWFEKRLDRNALTRAVGQFLFGYRFARSFGSFQGVFRSFAEARIAAPDRTRIDFNCREYAAEYQDRRDRVFSFDYPILFWLKPLLSEGC